MKKLILPVIAVTMVVGCTPHGKWSPYSTFNRGSALELQEATRQASMAKTPQQALAYYEAVYNNNPRDEVVAITYAKELRKAGFPERGIKVLERKYSGNPSQEVVLEYMKNYIATGRFDSAEKQLKIRIAREAEDYRDEMVQNYLAAVRHARVQKIIEPERPDFGEPQGNPQYHNLLGVIYDAQGKREKAEVEFRNALSRWDGEKGVVENNLALCLANQGKLEEAMTIISKAFVDAPERPQVARNLEIITALYKGEKN